MCGRYLSPDQAALERDNDLRVRNPFVRVYNAAPSLELPGLRGTAAAPAPAGGGASGGPQLAIAPGREVVPMRWGLVPSWWSRPELPTSTINARSEEAAAKPMWRDAVRRGRALVPALGWYEWQVGPAGKQPYFLHAADNGLVWFAGLWAARRDAEGHESLTFAILTRAASAAVAPVHNRMPVVLPPAAQVDWLAPGTDRGTERLAAAVAAASNEFAYYPVSTYVNTPRNQGERCIAPLADGVAAPGARNHDAG
jgi:putative SOS response-associated peptidase YedK